MHSTSYESIGNMSYSVRLVARTVLRIIFVTQILVKLVVRTSSYFVRQKSSSLVVSMHFLLPATVHTLLL